jgi:hypothetical protein
MRKQSILLVSTILLIISLSCNFISGQVPGVGPTVGPTLGTSATPLSATGKGPSGLTAQATSAESVKLVWEPVSGAKSFRITVSTNGGDPLPVVDLASSVTSYEDFMAAPGSQMTYAVEAVGDSGSIGQSIASVTTAARQPHPFTVQVQTDDKEPSVAKIGPDGGSVSVTDAKGVEYRLDIPAGALETQVNITLTTVKQIGGWPLKGDMLAAIKIGPEGVHLDNVATLTITLPGSPAKGNLSTLGFAFSGAGDEFHLQPGFEKTATSGFLPQQNGVGRLASPLQAPKTIIILPVTELHGNGLGQGSAADVGSLVQNSPPSDAGAALDQKEAAQAASDDDLAPLVQVNNYANLLERAAFEVFNTIGKAQDCAETRSAIGSVTGWLWEAQFRNLDSAEIKRGHDLMVEDLAKKIKEVIDEAARKCKEQGPKKSAPPGTGCAKGLIRSVSAGNTQLFKDVQQQMLKDYGTSALTDPDAQLRQCTAKFSVNQQVGDVIITGNICDLESIFHLHGGGAGDIEYTFVPGTKTSGGFMSETGSGGGAAVSASGSYNVSGIDSDNPLLKVAFSETVYTPVGNFDHALSADLKLQPIESGACP